MIFYSANGILKKKYIGEGFFDNRVIEYGLMDNQQASKSPAQMMREIESQNSNVENTINTTNTTANIESNSSADIKSNTSVNIGSSTKIDSIPSTNSNLSADQVKCNDGRTINRKWNQFCPEENPFYDVKLDITLDELNKKAKDEFMKCGMSEDAANFYVDSFISKYYPFGLYLRTIDDLEKYIEVTQSEEDVKSLKEELDKFRNDMNKFKEGNITCKNLVRFHFEKLDQILKKKNLVEITTEVKKLNSKDELLEFVLSRLKNCGAPDEFINFGKELHDKYFDDILEEMDVLNASDERAVEREFGKALKLVIPELQLKKIELDFEILFEGLWKDKSKEGKRFIMKKLEKHCFESLIPNYVLRRVTLSQCPECEVCPPEKICPPEKVCPPPVACPPPIVCPPPPACPAPPACPEKGSGFSNTYVLIIVLISILYYFYKNKST
jgi:hypothetical protein